MSCLEVGLDRDKEHIILGKKKIVNISLRALFQILPIIGMALECLGDDGSTMQYRFLQ